MFNSARMSGKGTLRADSELDKDRRLPVVINLSTSKGVIASSLNPTQEHFSRILHDLSEDGLLSVLERNIRIENLADMVAIRWDAANTGCGVVWLLLADQ